MISVFDVFKIGVGPSSSHTNGPMLASFTFINSIKPIINQITYIQVDLFGSLSLTGKGHHTDKAVIMGLMGYRPDLIDTKKANKQMENMLSTHELQLDGKTIAFDSAKDIHFHSTALPLHENGMTINAYANSKLLQSETYYSLGGGFIVNEKNFHDVAQETADVPYPFTNSSELLEICSKTKMSISQIALKNELAIYSQNEIDEKLENIWHVMQKCMTNGMQKEGFLPPPLKTPRRANALYRQLKSTEQLDDPMAILDWVNMFAFAINEENAAGEQVVTAPTNGACGLVPAVLAYYNKFLRPVGKDEYSRFLLTSGVIGGLYKRNASISGAEVGCQGEIGVACSMAAAGLAELMGASPEQVCVAAEIGMEHNLGLTCDPVAGQVQIPCIERNGINAIKAINSARMALKRNSKAGVSLDKVIETMYETGLDMNAKYRETSLGGLAIKVKVE